MNAECDHSLIWSGMKDFATAWPSQWTRSNHNLFHPKFRAAVQTLVVAANTRGFTVAVGGASARSGKQQSPQINQYYLDRGIVERIVKHMAADQAAWVPIVE